MVKIVKVQEESDKHYMKLEERNRRMETERKPRFSTSYDVNAL